MTQLTPILYAVEVPMYATRFHIHNNMEKTQSIDLMIYCSDFIFSILPIKEDGLFKIIGEVTKDEIGFDCDPYVEKKYFKSLFDGSKQFHFKNYLYPHYISVSNDDSFRSLLHSKGLYFENTVIKPNEEDYYYDSHTSFDEVEILWDKENYELHLKEWQEAENKIIKGKLLILEKL